MRRASAFAVVAALLVASAPAAAKTYKPNKTGDHPPGACTASDCTLREAVIKANSHSGFDRIVLRAGHRYSLDTDGTGEDQSQDGDLDIRGGLKVKSDGRRRAKISGDHHERILDAFARTRISRLRITGGLASLGGGVLAERNVGVVILRSVVAHNDAGVGGGGVATDGGDQASVVIRRSTIAHNEANSGGGVFAQSLMFIRDSTVSDNEGANGGGLLVCCGSFTDDPRVILDNDTIDDNDAVLRGGGIYAEAALVRMNAVTVAHNHANDQGGGVYGRNGGSYIPIKNSLIARNTAPSYGDCRGQVVSEGQNILQRRHGCEGIAHRDADFVNLEASRIKVGKLRDNGGPTKTDAIGRGSIAINRAGSDSPNRDQRGVRRHEPDIGAFERT